MENSMDRGAWWATVHRVTKSQTQPSNIHFYFSECLSFQPRSFLRGPFPDICWLWGHYPGTAHGPKFPHSNPRFPNWIPPCSFPSRASHPPGHSHLKSRTHLWPYLFLSIYIQRIKKSCRISFQTLSQTFSLFYRELSKMQIWSCCSFLLSILNFF